VATASPRRLSRREFARALRLGLGRARIDVRRHGLAGREDLLVAVCLRNPTRDPQLEGGLDGWLLDIARDGDATRLVRDAVVRAASRRIAGRRNRRQIGFLLAHFALDGDRGAARALLRMIDAQPPDDHVADPAILGLGETAWRRVIRSYGRRWELARLFDWSWIVYRAHRELGAQRTIAALREETAGRAAFRELAALVESEERSIRGRSPEPEVDASLDALERLVRGPRRRARLDLGRWGRHATSSDRAEAVGRLVAETDARRIVHRLWALRRRPPRKLHPRFFVLARHSVRLVRVNAASLLADFKDDRVRRIALRMLRDDPVRALDGCVLRMLERNARDEDAAAIAAALPTRASREVRDAWARGVKSIVDPMLRPPWRQRRSRVWTPLLLRAMEVTPCRDCRASILRLLVERGAATEAMLREALFDAADDARKLARDELAKLSSARARGGSRGRP